MLSATSLYVHFRFCGILLSVIMTPFLFFFRTAFSWLRAKVFLPVGAWVETHRKGLSFFAVFALLAVFYNLSSTVACEGGVSSIARVTCSLVSLVVWFLSAVVEMLGRLMILLVDIFMHFAAYNSFGTAQPVQIGWPIVRDVCNMFFILILLISAFATIIGYPSDYDYRKVLPKLLVMAVLINFSKTLILLLVDFSQVVMLSFVNAFSQAGPGNFAQIFQFNKMLEIASTAAPAGTVPTTVTGSNAAAREATTALNATGNNTATTGGDLGNYVNIIASVMLAMILMCVACGVMIIMIMYVIARIVGLWIALIFSPIAFFASALPGSLQKSLSAFTSDYWGRLSAMLTGGPIIAFFLWLTFAVVQGANGDLAGGTSLIPAGAGASNPQAFLSTIGNTQSLATFIVGVAMMMMALEQAAKTAGQVNATVGSYAKKVAEKAKSAAVTIARLPDRAIVGAGKAVGGVGLAGVGVLDRKYNLSGRAASGLENNALTRTAINPLVKRVSKALTGKETDLLGIAERNKKLDKDDAAMFNRRVEATPEDSQAEARAGMGGFRRAMGFETKGTSEGRASSYAKTASDNERKTALKQKMDEFKKNNPQVSADQRAQVERGFKQQIDLDALKNLNEAKNNFTKAGNIDEAIKVGEAMDKKYEQKPSLIMAAGLMNTTDAEAKEKDVMKKLQKDKAAAEASTVGTDAKYLMKMLPKEAWEKKGDNIVGIDAQYEQKFLETHKGTKAAEGLAAMKKQILGTPGGVSEKTLAASKLGKDSNGNLRLYDPSKQIVPDTVDQKTGAVISNKAVDDSRFMKTAEEIRVGNEFAAEFKEGGPDGRDPANVLGGGMTDSAGKAVYENMVEFGAKSTFNNKALKNTSDYIPAQVAGQRLSTAMRDAATNASLGLPDDLRKMMDTYGAVSQGLKDVDTTTRAIITAEMGTAFDKYIDQPDELQKLSSSDRTTIQSVFMAKRESRDQLSQKASQSTLSPIESQTLAQLDKQFKDAADKLKIYESQPGKKTKHTQAMRNAILGNDK